MSKNNLTKFLQSFSPCDVSDALVHFGYKTGGFIPNLSPFSPNNTGNSTVGPAYTVLYAPISDPRPSVPKGYIDDIPSGSILVIALTKELQSPQHPFVKVNNALYGGLMSTRAHHLGANGSVILGRIRDVEEHRELQYPVFAYGLGTCAPGPVVKVVGVNVPLEVITGDGDQLEVIHPGEFIIGDVNGVVRVPREVDVERLVKYIPQRVEADRLVASDIKQGVRAGEAQKKRRAGLSSL